MRGNMPVCPWHAPFHQLGSELSMTWIKSPRRNPSSPSSWGSKSKRAWTYVGCCGGGGQEKHCYTSHADWAGHQGEGTCAGFPAPPEIAPFLLPSPFAFARSKLRRAGAARSVTTAQRRWEQMARRRPATGRRAARAASRERALETAMGFFV